MHRPCPIAMTMALIFALILSFATLSPCANAQNLPIVQEKETFTIVAVKQTLDLTESFNEKVAAIQAEETTNIHIDWVEMTDPTERVNLMLASNDLPDAFLNVLSEGQLLKNMSLFIQLNELIPQYMPTVKQQYDENNLWDLITMTDGNIYTLITGDITSTENWGGAIPMINQSWLTKLGLEVPTTLDEYYDVLVAIRDGDPNGNGQKDEIPVVFCQNDWCTHILELGNSWGFRDYYKIEDGQFIATPLLPEFRSFLEFYHKCYEEGLIDPEGFSQTMQQWLTKWREDRLWLATVWTASAVLEQEAANNWVVMRPVPAPGFEGKTTVSGFKNLFNGNRFGFAVTKACENPEVLLRWFDSQSADTKTKLQWRLGEQGVLWDYNEASKPVQLFPPATASMGIENMKHTYGNVHTIPCLLNFDEVPEPEMDPNDGKLERIEMVQQVMDLFPTERLPDRSTQPEKVIEREQIWADLKPYLDSFVATSIVNGISDAEWEQHLQDAEDYGIYAWAQWYQDFIDKKI